MKQNLKTITEVELYDSAEVTDNPVRTIGEGEEVQVTQINIGDRYQYCEVEYEGKKYFMRSCFLEPSEVIYEAIYDESHDGLRESEESGDDIKIGVPYRKNGRVHIVVETGYFDKKELEENLGLTNLENLKAAAAHDILEYYGKNVDADQYEEKLLEFILNPFGLLEVGNFRYSVRPGKSIKVKFSIHEKYINFFDDMTLEDYTIQNINTNFVTTNFRLNETEMIIKNLSKVLDKFQKSSSLLSGNLQGFNFRQLSVKSKKFLADFKKYLYENDIVITKDSDNKVELGFDKDTGTLKYVLYFDPAGRFLKIGMSYLCRIFDPDISRMILEHKNIIKSVNCNLDPIRFAKKYSGFMVYNPAPKEGNSKGSPISVSIGEIQPPKIAKLEPEFSISTASDSSKFHKLTQNEGFRSDLIEVLTKSRDLVGDKLLIELPNIINNIGDLQLLYELVLNNVSMKTLVDMLVKCVGSELSMPELEEIKLRGVLKMPPLPELGDIVFEYLEPDELSDYGEEICSACRMGKNEFSNLISSLSSVQRIGTYMIHYKEDGSLGGMIPEYFSGDLESILLRNDLNNCENLSNAVSSEQFDFSIFYQKEMAQTIICEITTSGLPEFQDINPCFGVSSLPSVVLPSIKIDLFDFYTKLDASCVRKSTDEYFKKSFRRENDPQGEPPGSSTGDPDRPSVRRRLLEIPKVSFKMCDLELTKEKLLKRMDGVDIDFEIKKIDSQFSFPSIQEINPSFDFGGFQFQGLDDIFGGAIESIEDSIKAGIEKSLVISFKTILKRVLDCSIKDFSKLEKPDFGFIKIGDIMNASVNTNFDAAIDIAKGKISISMKSKSANNCGDMIEVREPTKKEVEKMFDDISNSASPFEVINILKGRVTEKDCENLTSSIEDPISSVLDCSTFIDIFEEIATIVDFDLLDELENAFDNEEVFVSLCEKNEIPFYSNNHADIKDSLRENYANISEEELGNIAEDIVDEVKDSLVDAIGNLKDNYNDVLPFDENPCSFMPPQTSIPAMNFVNDIVFDNIFDTIEKQYKNDAATLQDAFLVTTSSDEYVKMRNYPDDAILKEFRQLSDGTYEPVFETLADLYPDKFDFNEENPTIYNKEFGYNYYGEGTKLYFKQQNGRFTRADSGFELKKVDDEWDFKENRSGFNNIYAKKQIPTSVPVPMAASDFRTYNITTAVSKEESDFLRVSNTINSTLKGEPIRVSFDFKETLGFEVEQYDPNSGEFECIENFYIKSVKKDPFVITGLFKHHTRKVAKQSMDWEYKFNKFKSMFDSYSSGLIPTILGSMSRNMRTALLTEEKDSELFELDNMLAFIIDNDSVNLLKLQDSKNSAREEFNSECSFSENDNSLSTSSIKHLIYLLVRVQVIEEIVKGAFCNSNAHDVKATRSFIAIVWAKLNKYLEAQKDAFSVKFSEKYLEAYKEEFAYDSFTFMSMVREIYSDIQKSFEKIFRKSEDVLPLLANQFAYDTETVQDNLSSYVEEFMLAYISGKKFFVQRVYRNKEGKEIFYFGYNQLSLEDKSKYKLYLRLSYILKIGRGSEMPWNFTGEYDRRELREDSKIYKLKNSISHEYLANYGIPSNFEDYYLLPLAEMRAEYSNTMAAGSLDQLLGTLGTKGEISKLLIADTGEDTDVYNFLMNVVRVDHLKSSIEELVKVLVESESPEISLIFSETKDLIKRNIETLDQDPSAFESQDMELDSLTLEQQSGISTNPEYSATAKKMALMTVPLIIKGFAEQFDPNIKIASKIRQGASLAGFDIPPPAASLMALPMNLIPFAPGPPIGPLGLLYLASSFLEPKERKRLADLKRGDNLNPGADPETGTFVGGTLEEQQETLSELSAEARRLAQEKYNEISDLTKDFFAAFRKEIEYLRDNMPPLESGSDEDSVPVTEIDLPDNGGSDLYPLGDAFGLVEDGTLHVSDPHGVGAVAKKGNLYESGLVSFDCLEDYVFENVLYYSTFNNDLSDLFEKLFWMFQLFFPAPKAIEGLGTGGFNTALIKYLKYCKKFDMQQGSLGFKINNFLTDPDFVPAKRVLRHMSRTQHVIENLCQYYMYELFMAFEQNQNILDSKYENVSRQYNKNFESYRSDLEQEDYDDYRRYVASRLDINDDNSTQIYSDFISSSSLRYARARTITETDQNGRTIGDKLYGTIGIFGNPITEFAGLNMTDLLQSLRTRYLQSLQNG